ncbi:Dyp-type peroxidase [Pseudarthrobacter sp. P1]|uniref:Dyp-type peroxidase n=1 Tax=Pseudarthrobacter sp. P1 TaxID=3418418 RepID=UPI003CF8922C
MSVPQNQNDGVSPATGAASPEDPATESAGGCPMGAGGGVSRRKFFGSTAGTAVLAAAAGVVAGAGAGMAGANALAGAQEPAQPGISALSAMQSQLAYPFYGPHQGGISTPPQDHLVFMSFDLTTTSRTDLQLVLAKWSAAMAEMTAGKPVGATEPGREQAVPVDTGEANGMGPQGLTLTLGFGPSLFDARFGLESFKPANFAQLPAMAGESLQPGLTGGDLCIQACAYDP